MNDVRIGELAEKYETSGRGPGFISDGDKWDPGGDSYGSYQLATTPGTLKGYLNSNQPYANKLKAFTPKSDVFNSHWKEIAKQDPQGFKQEQFNYVATISYNPARKVADSMNWPDTLAVNSALFSIANQHGGWKKILSKVGIYSDEVNLLSKLYTARKDYINSLSSLSVKLKQNLVKQRCTNELGDVLKLVDKTGPDPHLSSSLQYWVDRFVKHWEK